MKNKTLPFDQLEQLLIQWSSGNTDVENDLIELLYPEIKKIARHHFRPSKNKLLQTTEIVNEAFIRIKKQQSVNWNSKSHFLAIASKVIRRVVVDIYRHEISQKRGGRDEHLTLERMQNIIENATPDGLDWLDLNDLLGALSQIDPMAANVVEYKIFGGLTLTEIADVLSVSKSTVSRNWQFARSWLLMQLKS
ncbi:ECF-type sigma factor [Marinicella sp. W31]|uniref:ECF-type sigma factor n=1 Tax=Marinicella sp. W31 TaxID=3023713 RepID=UPI003757AA87